MQTKKDQQRDPLMLLARQRVISAGAELEAALANKQGGHIVLQFVEVFRQRAAEAMVALIEINLSDPAEIPKALILQNEVKRYDEWVAAMAEFIATGVNYDQEMADQDREQLLDMLASAGPRGEREAVALGLIDAQQNID